MNAKSSVYSAEWALQTMLDRSDEYPTVEFAGSTFTLPIERKFSSIESIQTYVDKVLRLNWVRARYPNAARPVTVRERKGQAKAHYEHGGVIAIPPYMRNKAWAMREIVVLHEIAHHLAKGDGHGGKFCEVFVTLVSEIIGSEAGFILRALFYSEGVKIG